MRNVLAILRKELNVYFTTVIAYAGSGAYAFLMGLLFVSSLNRYQEATSFYLSQQQPEMLERLNFNDAIIAPMFSTGVWMLLFFVPFLTMRLFAEEKSGRTFELLMTAPVRSIEIVLGKFLAVTLLIAVFSLVPLIFPLILDAFGDGGVDWMPVLSATLIVFLLGVCFSTFGLFVSSLTESQIVAALVTFAGLLIGFVLPMIAARLEGDWRDVLVYAAPLSHVGRAIEGRLAIGDLVYFVSTVCVALLLTHRVVESHRWR